jgi:hypothetical protein
MPLTETMHGMIASKYVRRKMISALTVIAPEISPNELRDEVPLRDRVDLDSRVSDLTDHVEKHNRCD